MIVYYSLAQAIAKADRSTHAFLRLISLPLLLTVDMIVGYNVRPIQILGVLIVFASFCVVFSGHKLSRRGSGYVLASAIFSVITVSLYKYDITHFNSVAAEQIIEYCYILGFFTVVGWFKGESTFQYLLKPWTEAQSFFSGAGFVLSNTAYNYAPASVVSAGLRGFGLLWAILFGKVYFHERHVIYKLSVFALVIGGLALTALHV